MSLNNYKFGYNLTIRNISELSHHFHIPAYQRGYRWERKHVKQLLEDLLEHFNAAKQDTPPYYLQPVVVAPKTATKDDLDMKESKENEVTGIDKEDNEVAAIDKKENTDSSVTEETTEINDYDLIDGQQRLTTFLIILKALNEFKANNPSRKQFQGLNFEAPFTIDYETRTDTQIFLGNVDKESFQIEDVQTVVTQEYARKFPDYLYIWHAYQEAKNWLANHDEDAYRIADILLNNVKIIWYELNEVVESWEKFAQLNVGKIPLTNSELVKALLLSDQNQDIKDYEKDIIVNQWDEIEKELSDKHFWSFLTTTSPTEPRIDFLFDLLASKPKNNRDDFFTFQHFSKLLKDNKDLKGKNIWDDIYSKYLRIKDWFTDPWYYHRIGYLVTIDDGSEKFREIFNYAFPENKEPKTKTEVRTKIKELIEKSINWRDVGIDSIWMLTYDDKESEDYKQKKGKPHNQKIINLLTLYNVMIYDYLNKAHGSRYPFYAHNNASGGWSLEHIHAQHSERLVKAEQWQNWITDHIESLKRIKKYLNIDKKGDVELIKRWNNLQERMCNFHKKQDGDEFNEIVNIFLTLTQSDDPRANNEFKDELTNIALLSKDENSRLNNSTFDVKRIIVGQNISTDFLPMGTEKVFLKSISDTLKDNSGAEHPYSCDIDHLYYWGAKDRLAYKYDIWNRLKEYLPAYENPLILTDNDNDAP